MKKAILSTILLLGSTSLLADTTMCFKENHQSMSNIENTPLDGGACNGKNTINQMKAKGWSVDDIKISQTTTGMNFIYILKTATAATTTSNFTGNQAQMEANIIAKLEQKKVSEEKAKVELELEEAKIDAKNIYVNKCQSCHGVNGELTRSSSRALKDLTIEQMEESIKDYKLGRIDRMSATTTAPIHINNLDPKTIKGVYAYLKELNNK
ncbi:MAG: c-type cytochrome [Aliarcobacter sp.]|nr:c-type cytochrome [Aliarcobacter sp.]